MMANRGRAIGTLCLLECAISRRDRGLESLRTRIRGGIISRSNRDSEGRLNDVVCSGDCVEIDHFPRTRSVKICARRILSVIGRLGIRGRMGAIGRWAGGLRFGFSE